MVIKNLRQTQLHIKKILYIIVFALKCLKAPIMYTIIILTPFNPQNPHDALKHDFASLNNDLIFYIYGFLNLYFHGTVLIISNIFFHMPPTLSRLHPSRIVTAIRGL